MNYEPKASKPSLIGLDKREYDASGNNKWRTQWKSQCGAVHAASSTVHMEDSRFSAIPGRTPVNL
jgi:hypothetical protein